MSGSSGRFVISLDMELFWGMRDRRTIAAYGPNLLGVRQAIPRMLDAFEKHQVKATFAAVGLLFFDDKKSMLAGLPELRPAYTNKALSPYNGHIAGIGENELEDPYHFGASLMRMIASRPGQEVACHTFSHYYCLEEGQTEEQFTADLTAALAAARSMGITLRSFVFPRNQYNERYVRICGEHGIIAFRGNEHNWSQSARNRDDETRVRRAFRLLDTWFDLTGPNCHPIPSPTDTRPVDIPSSRFLRPWSPRTKALEGLRARRIMKAMDHAAQHGKIFHLWWHPHNFGIHLEENMAFLERILRHYELLRERHGFTSKTMADVADQGQHTNVS